MRSQTIASLIAAALAFAATPAGASPADQISTRIKISDLDLQRPDGAQAALRRINTAARAICGEEPNVRDLNRQALTTACVRKAVNAAVASARNPMLAAVNGTPIVTTTVASAD
ncbi:UrcA family protein [Phenylobacterium sp. LjRoot225]|uniref:UrcA family protein n=1 Tax=Phenylobacterium sp. LjRoot225 TaxID=3342285 RepID=UPI003ECC75D9